MRGLSFGLLSVIAAGMVLAGCKASPAIEIYLGDLKAVADGEAKTPAMASARISFDVISKTNCEAETSKLTTILKKSFSEITGFTCVDTKGAFAAAHFDTKLPVVLMAQDGTAKLPSLLTLAVNLQGEDLLTVSLFLSSNAMKSLAAEIRSNYMYDIGAGEIGSVTLTLVNDLPEPQKINGVVDYVNGKPKPVRWSETLQRREKLEIGLSNVHADGLRTGFGVPVFQVPYKK